MNNHRFQIFISKIVLVSLLLESALFPHIGRAEDLEMQVTPSGMVAGMGNIVCIEAPQCVSHPVQSLPETKSRKARATRQVVITAYSSTPDQTDDTPFITANGTRVRDGIVAANFLRFNTQVRIPEIYGDKIFYVTDRMHPRFSNRVDIWMETREEARQFGVKRTIIEVY